MIAAALLVAPLLATAPGVASAAAPLQQVQAGYSSGKCTSGDTSSVTVAIDFQNLGGGTIVRCAHGLGAGARGNAALAAAGINYAGTARWGSAFVCRIFLRPGPTETLRLSTGDYREPCTDTPPALAYWSYWQANEGGAWEYSQLGVLAQKARLGGFEGWSFSMNAGANTNPAPGVNTSLIKAAPVVTPPATTRPPATTQLPATTRSTTARPTPPAHTAPLTRPALPTTSAPRTTARQAPPTSQPTTQQLTTTQPTTTQPTTTQPTTQQPTTTTTTTRATTIRTPRTRTGGDGTTTPSTPAPDSPAPGAPGTGTDPTGTFSGPTRESSGTGTPAAGPTTDSSVTSGSSLATSGAAAAGAPSSSAASGARSGAADSDGLARESTRSSAGAEASADPSTDPSAGSGSGQVDPNLAGTQVQQDLSSPWPVIAVLALALAAGGAAFVIARRRRGDGI